MKPGLSLRVSQHLTLTPHLQQSTRLLQLSTLELTQEIEQMLDENPFLERMSDEAPREEFGLDSADTPAQADDYSADEVLFSAATGSSAEALPDADTPGSAADEPDWGGDGSVGRGARAAEWGGGRWAPGRPRGAATRRRASTTTPKATGSKPPNWPRAKNRWPPSCTARRWRCACPKSTAPPSTS